MSQTYGGVPCSGYNLWRLNTLNPSLLLLYIPSAWQNTPSKSRPWRLRGSPVCMLSTNFLANHQLDIQ
jgi:hypothetical protein